MRKCTHSNSRQRFDIRGSDEFLVVVDCRSQLSTRFSQFGIYFRQILEKRDDLLSRPVTADPELLTGSQKFVSEFRRFFIVLLLFLVAVFLNLGQL